MTHKKDEALKLALDALESIAEMHGITAQALLKGKP